MNEPTEFDDEDAFPDSVTRDFAMAMEAAWLKTKDSAFTEMVHEYKAVENAFIPNVVDNDFAALEMRKRVAESIFKSAVTYHQPWDICLAYWNDVVHLGITQIEAKCTMTWYYAECCRMNGKAELGLRILDPLIDELRSLQSEPDVGEVNASFYRQQLAVIGKLRAKLHPQQR